MKQYYKDKAKLEGRKADPEKNKLMVPSINAEFPEGQHPNDAYYTSAAEDLDAEMSAAENGMAADFLRLKGKNGPDDGMEFSSSNAAKLTTPDTDGQHLANRKAKQQIQLSEFAEPSDVKKAKVSKLRGQIKGGKSNVKYKKRGRKRGQHRVVADLFLALSLCHNVTPVITEEEPSESNEELMQEQPQSIDQSDNKIIPNEEDQGKKKKFNRVFQASSPDEIALIKFAEDMGMRLENRSDDHIQIKEPTGKLLDYEILNNFPFSSETKRMGIIVKNQNEDKIMFYLKGAEVVMETKVKPDQRVSLTEACEQLAQDGLRTLVIC